MDWIQLIVLALVQGITEFLPVSSSAHLILVPELLGWPDQGLGFDVAVHMGTLLAVVLYFRNEVTAMTLAWFGSLAGQHNADSKLAWYVLLATLPVLPAGLLANMFEEQLRSPLIIATTTFLFGVLLWVADRVAKAERNEYELLAGLALVIGLAQCLALIPGTSRSGITITAALLLGLTPIAAARFSFLLSIPVIVMAGTLKTAEWIKLGAPGSGMDLLIGAGLAAVSAGLCIHGFIKLLAHVGMWPFVVYRLMLALMLFAVFA